MWCKKFIDWLGWFWARYPVIHFFSFFVGMVAFVRLVDYLAVFLVKQEAIPFVGLIITIMGSIIFICWWLGFFNSDPVNYGNPKLAIFKAEKLKIKLPEYENKLGAAIKDTKKSQNPDKLYNLILKAGRILELKKDLQKLKRSVAKISDIEKEIQTLSLYFTGGTYVNIRSKARIHPHKYPKCK